MEELKLTLSDTEVESSEEKVVRQVMVINEPSTSIEEYDRKFFNEISGGDIEFEKVVIGLFLEENPKEIEILKAAVDSSNIEAFMSTLNKMKSPIKILGFVMILNKIANLEKIHKVDELSLKQEFTWIEQELNKYCKLLRSYVNRIDLLDR